MRCLPFCSCKKVYKYWGESDTHYQWYDKLSMWPQSFNDQPAVFYLNGDMWYCKEGQCHRGHNKPALIYSSGDKFYFKEGKEYYLEDQE